MVFHYKARPCCSHLGPFSLPHTATSWKNLPPPLYLAPISPAPSPLNKAISGSIKGLSGLCNWLSSDWTWNVLLERMNHGHTFTLWALLYPMKWKEALCWHNSVSAWFCYRTLNIFTDLVLESGFYASCDHAPCLSWRYSEAELWRCFCQDFTVRWQSAFQVWFFLSNKNVSGLDDHVRTRKKWLFTFFP